MVPFRRNRNSRNQFRFPRPNNRRANQGNRDNHQNRNQQHNRRTNRDSRNNNSNSNHDRDHNQNNNRNRNRNNRRDNNRNNNHRSNNNNQSESEIVYDETQIEDFWHDIDNVIAGYENFPEADEIDPWEHGSKRNIPYQFWQWSIDQVPTTLKDLPIREFPFTGWGPEIDIDPRRPRPTRPGEAAKTQKQLWREGWGPLPKLDAWYQRKWEEGCESMAKAKSDGWGPPPRLDAWYERAYLEDADQYPENFVFTGWKPPADWPGYRHQHCVTQEEDPDLLQSSVRIVECVTPEHLPHKGFVPANQTVPQRLFDTPIFNETNPPPPELSHDTGVRYSPTRGFFQLMPTIKYDSNRGYFLEFDRQNPSDGTSHSGDQVVDREVDHTLSPPTSLPTPPYQYPESDMDCGHDGNPDEWQGGRRLTICYYDENGQPIPVDSADNRDILTVDDLLNIE